MKISIEITAPNLTKLTESIKAKTPELKTKAASLNTVARNKIKAWANTL